MSMLEAEDKVVLGVEDYWGMLVRRRYWLVLITFLVWASVWGLSWFLPTLYRSSTTILVERQKVPEQYVVANVDIDPQAELQTMTQKVLSRSRLQKIIEDYHLYPKQAARSIDDAVDRMRSDIDIEFVQPGAVNGKNLTSANVPRAREITAFSIAYSATSPRLAQQVDSQLTSLFIEENLQARQQQSENTTQFLNSQLEEARKNLTDQEEKLKQFKGQYIGQLPEQAQSNVQILSGLQGRLMATNEALNHAQQQKLYLQSLLGQYKDSSSDGISPSAQEDQLKKLRNQLNDLRSRYTETHPDVQSLKMQIADLEKQMAEPQKDSKKPSHLSAAGMQVQSQLDSNEMEITNRQKQAKDLEQQIEAYQGRLNASPLREQQMSNLARDHDQSLSNYESLLSKKMSSELATNLEKRQQGEQFRIIDPPSLPTGPDSPNRVKFSLMGLVVGMVFGFVAAAGTEFVDDRLQSEKQLKGYLPLPVIVEIPSLPTEGEQSAQKRRLLMEWAVGGILALLILLGNAFVLLRG